MNSMRELLDKLKSLEHDETHHDSYKTFHKLRTTPALIEALEVAIEALSFDIASGGLNAISTLNKIDTLAREVGK